MTAGYRTTIETFIPCDPHDLGSVAAAAHRIDDLREQLAAFGLQATIKTRFVARHRDHGSASDSTSDENSLPSESSANGSRPSASPDEGGAPDPHPDAADPDNPAFEIEAPFRRAEPR